MTSFSYYHWKVLNWSDDNKFPELDTDKYVAFYDKYPLFMFAPRKLLEAQELNLCDIKGDNWAFEKKETRGSYPKTTKLLDLLGGYVNGDYPATEPGGVPPIEVVKINGEYFLQEGNHRLYLSKVLGREKILADVSEYDYSYLLKHSYLQEQPWGYAIVLDNGVHDVNQKQAEEYAMRKEEFTNKNMKEKAEKK